MQQCNGKTCNNEPGYIISYKIKFAPSEHSDQPALISAHSDQGLHRYSVVVNELKRVQATAKTLISMRGREG